MRETEARPVDRQPHSMTNLPTTAVNPLTSSIFPLAYSQLGLLPVLDHSLLVPISLARATLARATQARPPPSPHLGSKLRPAPWTIPTTVRVVVRAVVDAARVRVRVRVRVGGMLGLGLGVS